MNIFLDKMKALLGDEFDDFLKFYNSSGEHYRGLRVNTLKCSVEKLEKLLDFDLKSAPFAVKVFIFRMKLLRSVITLCIMRALFIYKSRLLLRQ